MSGLYLSSAIRTQLRHLLKEAETPRQLRRAQALLWMAEGQRPTEVARRLGVSYQTVYNWTQAFEARSSEPVTERLQDRARSGRPATKGQTVETVLQQVWPQSPLKLGYRSPIWTAPLVRQHLHQKHQLTVSTRTIRRALRRLGYRFKRPKQVYARRSPTWRQAKGGCKPD